jgi:hypothetical protein
MHDILGMIPAGVSLNTSYVILSISVKPFVVGKLDDLLFTIKFALRVLIFVTIWVWNDSQEHLVPREC